MRLMKRFRYFLRGVLAEIISVAAAITVSGVSYIMSEEQSTGLLIIVITLVTVLVFLVLIRTRKDRQSLYYLPLMKPREKANWIGNGTWDYSKSNDAYLITDSLNGFIFNKCLLWGDYVADFEFKIVRDNCGWIVRARDLSNYVMLQCGLDQINPHIKRNGIFFISHGKDPGVNLTFDTQLHLDLWYRATVYCEKSNIRIQIRDQEWQSIFDRIWTIPERQVFRYKEKIGEEDKERKTIVLPVDLDFGTIGFRCWAHEKSLIRDLLIRKM